MATNLVSGATAYRAIVASVMLAAMLMVSTRLHALSPRAPIVRYGTRLLLAIGLVAVSLTVVGPASLAPYMIFLAVGLTGAAVLIPVDVTVRLFMLVGTATVGSGAAVTGLGIGLVKGGWAGGAVLLGVGVTLVGIGVAALVSRNLLFRLGIIGAATAAVGLGVVILVKGGLAGGVGVIGAGIAAVGVGVAFVVRGESVGRLFFVVAGVIFAVTGVMAVSLGIVIVVTSDVTLGAVVVGGGVAFVGIGIAILVGRDLIDAVTLVGAGVVLVGTGSPSLVKGDLLVGAASVGAGIGCVALGIANLITSGRGTGRMKDWLASLTEDPGERAGNRPADPGQRLAG
jgi:hypothetical protein